MTDRYTLAVHTALQHNDVPALAEMTFGRLCACLGARDGEPKCPCRMLADAARRQIVPFALRRGKIVRVPVERV